MCTLIFLYKVMSEYPIIALQNRYALKGTYETSPQRIKLKYDVYCPIDLQVKGTWIGFNEKGLFLAITDQHTGEREAYRSRGLLALNILGHYSTTLDAKEYLKMELKKGICKKSNFIIADFNKAYHLLYDDTIYEMEVKRGYYILTNITILPSMKVSDSFKDKLEKAEKRKERAEELAKELVNMIKENKLTITEVINRLIDIAKDHKYGKSKLSICYHDDEWFMSSSTIIAINKNVSKSRILYCKGNACEGQFIDYSPLLTIKAREVGKKSIRLEGTKIALCLTGSVATIEAPKLARELRRHGAEVQCYMTESAIKYGISPYVMEWATKNRVIITLTGNTEHLEEYDLVVVYPATFNTINKIVKGVADNAVTTLCAATPPNRLLIVPAMNIRLYSNLLLQESLKELMKKGATVLSPRFEEGIAKIPKVSKVVDYIIRLLSRSKLNGRKVLILTGPTRYFIDVIRYISNRASGRIGLHLAKEAFYRGCTVKVIYGPGIVSFPDYIPVIKVSTTEDYLKYTLKELKESYYDYVIFSAAIMDYKPKTYIDEKIKSGRSELTVKLVPTPKVIEKVRNEFPNINIIAFKLEYNVSKEVLIKSAKELLNRINALFVIANDLINITEEKHEAIIVTKDGRIVEFQGSKEELAIKIFDLIEELT